jgi:serine-type D-Ala-D-Ala carboxypeptidase/endopeptidase
MKKILFAVLVFLFVPLRSASAQSAEKLSIPTDSEIRKMLVERIGDKNQSTGIVVGVIEPAGRRIVAYGGLSKDDKRSMDGNTVFEIGSITKVFTSLLLADMVQHGELALSDPAAKYLPKGVKMPERGGRVITLEDLSRHRSGLPRLPTNFGTGSDPKNPYAGYSVEQLYQFLSGYTLPRDIGAEFEYSNLGGGLLGHLLTLASGKNYETLIQTRIARPLQMNSTGIRLLTDMQSRLATGHDNRYEPTPNWDLPTLAGAGALRSTANDMLSFLAVQLGYTKSSLAPAIAATRARWFPAGAGMEIGLGWLKRSGKGREIIWHNGGTGGYRSFVGFDQGARTGVVVLTNVSTMAGVDDLGFHILDPESPLLPADSPLIRPPLAHTEIKLDTEVLYSYVGEYQFAPNVFMKITRDGGQLSAQLTGQGPAEIYPENKTDFFYKVVDAQILFRLDSQGRVNALILRQLGRDQLAQRVGGTAEPVTEWFGHRERPVDKAVFDNYVGQYQVGPGAVFTVTRNGDHLYVQLTGQQPLEVFAEGDGKFFSKIIDAQITFETAVQGPASALILHQGGRDLRASRITR